jgi:hypothetical protein
MTGRTALSVREKEGKRKRKGRAAGPSWAGRRGGKRRAGRRKKKKGWPAAQVGKLNRKKEKKKEKDFSFAQKIR